MLVFVIEDQPYNWVAHLSENLFFVLLTMAPPSQEFEPPANSGAVHFS
jgi:hypothetical protein